MKTPKLKARRMWANPIDFGEQSMHLTAHRDPSSDRGNVVLVAVIPLNDVEALIDQAASAIAKWRGYGVEYAPHYYSATSSVLAAIGVLPQQKKGLK